MAKLAPAGTTRLVLAVTIAMARAVADPLLATEIAAAVRAAGHRLAGPGD